MEKKARLGSDPLQWIKDSRGEDGKQSGARKSSKQSKHEKPGNPQLRATRQAPATEPEPAKTSKKGLREGWTRATFIMREDYVEKLKALAYWERKEIKRVIDEAIGSYLHGKKIEPIKREVE